MSTKSHVHDLQSFYILFCLFRKKKNDPVLAYLVIQALSMIIKIMEIVILAIGAGWYWDVPRPSDDVAQLAFLTYLGSYGTSLHVIVIILIVRAVIYAIVLGKSSELANYEIEF